MEPSIKLGRILGVEIGLHYTWIVIALLIAFSLAAHFQAAHPDWGSGIAWLTATITATLFFASIIVHELSHAIVAKMRNLPVHSITLSRASRSHPRSDSWLLPLASEAAVKPHNALPSICAATNGGSGLTCDSPQQPHPGSAPGRPVEVFHKGTEGVLSNFLHSRSMMREEGSAVLSRSSSIVTRSSPTGARVPMRSDRS